MWGRILNVDARMNSNFRTLLYLRAIFMGINKTYGTNLLFPRQITNCLPELFYCIVGNCVLSLVFCFFSLLSSRAQHVLFFKLTLNYYRGPEAFRVSFHYSPVQNLGRKTNSVGAMQRNAAADALAPMKMLCVDWLTPSEYIVYTQRWGVRKGRTWGSVTSSSWILTNDISAWGSLRSSFTPADVQVSTSKSKSNWWENKSFLFLSTKRSCKCLPI